MEVLDPRTFAEAAGALQLSPRPAALKGLRIGLLDNGKRNSRRLLEHLADALRTTEGLAEAAIVTKPNHSTSAPPALLIDLQQRFDLVVAGIGD